MASIPYQAVAVFVNKSAYVRTCPNEKTAWNTARDWVIRGVENQEKGFIVAPSMIQEVQVRKWEPPAADAE